MLTYGSVCSGIEAASVAWHPLGWKPSFFSEIDPFPRAVLRHRFPEVPLHGDFTTIEAGQYRAIDLLVGGTPCQSFSVAGLRGGLGDDRGNLALEFLRLADRLRPKWLAWENVPGVLSSSGGRDFGSILGGMVQLGYGFAYRVLDAQYVRVDGLERAVPQRRRRVFVVGYLGDWRRAAAALFERESLSGHPPPRREAGKGIGSETGKGALGGGEFVAASTVGALCANMGQGNQFALSDQFIASTGEVIAAPIASTLNAHYGEKMGLENQHIDQGAPLFIAFSDKDSGGFDKSPANASVTPAVAFDLNQITSRINRSIPSSEVLHTMPATALPPHIASPWSVRRLMPVECERLQGFPDGWTDVPYRGKPAADGPRYKALGNSMAVNVMRWIGQRIQMVEEIHA